MATPAFADPLADLEKAHSAYVAHKYDDAEARLRALLDPKTGELKDPDNIADARMYLGAVLVEEKRKDEADEVFEKLLSDKSDYKPDELLVSQEAINALLDARTRLRERIRRQQDEATARKAQEQEALEAAQRRERLRLEMLESMAAEERVVERNSRWVALLPFGVGQFQNRQNDLGWVFLSVEGLLATGSAVAAVVSIYEEGQANEALLRTDPTASDYNRTARGAAYFSDVLFGGLITAALVGAVHAELTFVPERVEIRKRALPQISVTPIVGPAQVGLAVGF